MQILLKECSPVIKRLTYVRIIINWIAFYRYLSDISRIFSTDILYGYSLRIFSTDVNET
ncbi:17605_t:CDS:2 [Cetraspora pellucida]|uniref:17605_t:CDS:1 n=1 Tax=Cetraspora pellucida TaxID=1433469 RepID=A0A9N9FKT4_9GLOM|nr:17605_t:CDS:2 [Cetraspora pellucida]